LPQVIIRPARSDEYDQVARVWMDSWVSTGLEDASNFLLAKLRFVEGHSVHGARDGTIICRRQYVRCR